MLVFDELKKNDPQLRFVAMMLVGGFFILLSGLWWVQVVSAHKYQSHQETQAYRTIRIPAVRGKILDREGRVLAEVGELVVGAKEGFLGCFLGVFGIAGDAVRHAEDGWQVTIHEDAKRVPVAGEGSPYRQLL